MTEPESDFGVDLGRPRRSFTVQHVAVGDAVALVDLAHLRGVVVNPTALAVWDHCDGMRTVEDVAAALGVQFGVPAAAILGEVHAAIVQFARDGLIDIAASGATAPCSSAKEIERRADGVAIVRSGASSCQQAVDAMAWCETVVVSIAGTRVGVRAADADATDLVRSALSRAIVDDDDNDVPATFSVVIVGTGGRRERAIEYGVFDGHRWCGAASSTAAAVIEVLAARLAALTPMGGSPAPDASLLPDVPDAWVRLDAGVAHGPRGAVVLVGYGSSARFLALRRRGWLLDTGPALIRVTSSDVLVDTPRVDIETLPVDVETAGVDLATPAGSMPTGPTPLLGFVTAGPDPLVADVGLGILLAVPHLLPGPLDDRAVAVDALARLVTTVPMQRSPRSLLVDVLDPFRLP